MKRLSCLSALVFCLQSFASFTFAQGVAPTCHSLTSGNLTYTQNFNTLASTSGSTGSAVPTGFGFAETGTGSDITYGVGTGTTSAANTYSFGDSVNPLDRAFGGVRSPTTGVNPTIGGCVLNNSGSTIYSLEITYDGEQWRLGATGRVDRLDFQYSKDATSLLDGTWTDVDGLDFTTPIFSGYATGLTPGNDASFRRTGINALISNLNLANGDKIYIRYLDLALATSNDGLAIDNFSLVAALTPTAASASISGRVTTADGRGIRNADVVLSSGSQRNSRIVTSTFGYYRFDGLRVGETYVLTVGSKRYTFGETSRVVSLRDEVTDANFTALQ